MPAAAIASVTRIVAAGTLGPDHRLHRRRRQVVTVDDQARDERVGGQLLPDDVRMPRQHRGAAVAEMRRERRAGRDRVGDLLRRRRGVADRDAHARGTRCSMSAQRARHLRRERDEHDAAAGRILPALEVVAARRRHVRARMRAARAVVRRDVRPFHVDPGDGRDPGMRGDDARARGEVLERRGDERRQAARHAGAAHPLERVADAIGGQVRAR